MIQIRGTCHGLASHLGIVVHQKGKMSRVFFSSSYIAACADNELIRFVPGSVAYVLGTIRIFWLEMGEKFAGGVREGSMPAEAKLLATRSSLLLADFVRLNNKYSNNVIT